MTENQEMKIDDLVKLWKNMPSGKLVLIKNDNGEPSYHLQQGGKIEDSCSPKITYLTFSEISDTLFVG